MTIHLGTQGWNYDVWRGPFYPAGTKPEEFLATYARLLDTVEVDSTFYATPSENAVLGWARRTPAHFTFALKLPRAITHDRRLVDAGDDLLYFCDRARLLGDKLAAVLVQLPPDLSPRAFLALERFLPLLPRDLRWAVEFRDPGWLEDDVFALLEDFGVALALVDGEWLPLDRVLELAARPTAGFAYLRWLAPRVLTDFTRLQIDKSADLARWADAIRHLARRVDRVYGYFNNHYEGHSPLSAARLMRLLDIEPIDPDSLVTQPSLF